MQIDLEQLRELMKALREFELDEIEIENTEERIAIRRSSGVSVTAAPVMAAPAPAAPAAAAAAPAEEVVEGEFITSPFVGTFYRSPSPDADPFIAEGASFSSGQSLCIVEAMKLMNEIEAEFSGTVLEILAENGKPVEYGDRLFRVRRG